MRMQLPSLTPISDRKYQHGVPIPVRECKASSSALPFMQALSDARSDADAILASEA